MIKLLLVIGIVFMLSGCSFNHNIIFHRDGEGFVDCGDKNLSPEDKKTCENLKYFQQIQEKK